MFKKLLTSFTKPTRYFINKTQYVLPQNIQTGNLLQKLDDIDLYISYISKGNFKPCEIIILVEKLQYHFKTSGNFEMQKRLSKSDELFKNNIGSLLATISSSSKDCTGMVFALQNFVNLKIFNQHIINSIALRTEDIMLDPKKVNDQGTAYSLMKLPTLLFLVTGEEKFCQMLLSFIENHKYFLGPYLTSVAVECLLDVSDEADIDEELIFA